MDIAHYDCVSVLLPGVQIPFVLLRSIIYLDGQMHVECLFLNGEI